MSFGDRTQFLHMFLYIYIYREREKRNGGVWRGSRLKGCRIQNLVSRETLALTARSTCMPHKGLDFGHLQMLEAIRATLREKDKREGVLLPLSLSLSL